MLGHFRPVGVNRIGMDYSAVYDNYDGGDPIGFGATEAEAIADLTENSPREEE